MSLKLLGSANFKRDNIELRVSISII